MRIAKVPGGLTFSLAAKERSFFHAILQSIILHYGVTPRETPPAIARVWYSTRGCESARQSTGDTEAWLADLHSLRRSRVHLLQEMAGALAASSTSPLTLPLTSEDAHTLMTALNDHRLWLAASHDIGECEAGVDYLHWIASLKPSQRQACLEINLLAEIIQRILEIIAPEATQWAD